jgi:hypothetical protein
MQKRKPRPKEKRKQRPNLKLRNGWNHSNSHAGIQGLATATCMVRTTNHNIPTDFINCQQWLEVNGKR